MAKIVKRQRRVENLLLQFTYLKVSKRVAVSLYGKSREDMAALLDLLREQGLLSTTGAGECTAYNVCKFGREGHLYGYGIEYEGPILDLLGERGWERRERREGVDEDGQEVIVYHFVRITEHLALDG
jgi:hypothetical protein